MQYHFWNNYNFIAYDLAIKLDIRLQNVIHKLELFLKESINKPYNKEYIEFYLAGSCLKLDTFRDIDIFFFTKNELDDMTACIDSQYFVYENNSNTYEYKGDIFQLVYRERFLNKPLSFIVDIFDFYSTKIAFKCKFNTKSFKIEIVESNIQEEFIEYIKSNLNRLSRVNRNPFVSLQRAIHFLKRGDNVPFSVFLQIFEKISDLDEHQAIEKHFDRLQGDEVTLKVIKEDITSFIENKRKKSAALNTIHKERE